jgi:hypothetical protein
MSSGQVSACHCANYGVFDRQWRLLSSADVRRVELCDIAADVLKTKHATTEKLEVLRGITAELEAPRAPRPARPSVEVLANERMKQEPPTP